MHSRGRSRTWRGNRSTDDGGNAQHLDGPAHVVSIVRIPVLVSSSKGARRGRAYHDARHPQRRSDEAWRYVGNPLPPSRLIHLSIDLHVLLHAHVATLGRYNTSWQLPQTPGLIGGARTGLLPPRHATRASWLVRSQDFPRRPQLDLVREWMR